jgi:beta-galactosidase
MMRTGSFSSMFVRCVFIVVVAASMLQAAPFVHQNSNRVFTKFNRAWRFNATDNVSFSGVAVNDSTGSWTRVCLPQQNITVKHMFFNGGTASGSGAAWAFISWYRKHYTPPISYNGRRFLLEFEGVSNIATVYVNGNQVGTHSGGYTPFTVDITSQITTGSDNVIAVRVNSQYQTGIPPETGSNIDFSVFGGIVRNVNLIVVDPLYVEFNWVSIPNATSSSSTPTGTVTSHVKLVNNAATSKNYTQIGRAHV